MGVAVGLPGSRLDGGSTPSLGHAAPTASAWAKDCAGGEHCECSSDIGGPDDDSCAAPSPLPRGSCAKALAGPSWADFLAQQQAARAAGDLKDWQTCIIPLALALRALHGGHISGREAAAVAAYCAAAGGALLWSWLHFTSYYRQRNLTAVCLRLGLFVVAYDHLPRSLLSFAEGSAPSSLLFAFFILFASCTWSLAVDSLNRRLSPAATLVLNLGCAAAIARRNAAACAAVLRHPAGPWLMDAWETALDSGTLALLPSSGAAVLLEAAWVQADAAARCRQGLALLQLSGGVVLPVLVLLGLEARAATDWAARGGQGPAAARVRLARSVLGTRGAAAATFAGCLAMLWLLLRTLTPGGRP